MGCSVVTYAQVSFFVWERGNCCWEVKGFKRCLKGILEELDGSWGGLYGCRYIMERGGGLEEACYDVVVSSGGDRRSLEVLDDMWECFKRLEGVCILRLNLTLQMDWGYGWIMRMEGRKGVEVFGVRPSRRVLDRKGVKGFSYYDGVQSELDDSFFAWNSG